MPTSRISRAQEVEHILLERLEELAGPDGRLPSEAEIAEMCSVSRTTVRSAVGALVARGLVLRRHGIGTFVNTVAAISNPLDQAVDFCEIIARNGCEPGRRHLPAAIVRPEAEVAEALQQPGELALQRRTVFTANKAPVIYCVNTIPLWVFPGSLAQEVIADPSISEPIYEFLQQRCNQNVDFHTASIWPDVAQNCDVQEFVDDPLVPVLVIDEVGYNSENRPVLHSLEYYPGRFMRFDLIRRRPAAL